VTAFWGALHLRLLRDTALPSLLLPANLPAVPGPVTHHVYCTPAEAPEVRRLFAGRELVLDESLLAGPHPRPRVGDAFTAVADLAAADGGVVLIAPCDHLWGHGLAAAVAALPPGHTLVCGHPRVSTAHLDTAAAFLRDPALAAGRDNAPLARRCLEEWRHPLVEYGLAHDHYYWRAERFETHWRAYFAEPVPVALRPDAEMLAVLRAGGRYGRLEVYDHELVDWAFRGGRLRAVTDSRELFHAEWTDPAVYNPTICNDWDSAAARHFRRAPLTWHTA
jgi:hypothetical protein